MFQIIKNFMPQRYENSSPMDNKWFKLSTPEYEFRRTFGSTSYCDGCNTIMNMLDIIFCLNNINSE